MSEQKIADYEFKPGFRGMAKDTGSDQTMFKGVHWGKAMINPAFKNIKNKIKDHLSKPWS